jgi:hypothetical protein
MNTPGGWLWSVAKHMCSRRACDGIVEPLLADLQREWWAARTARERALVRWRGTTAFWQAVALSALSETWRRVRSLPAAINAERALVAVYVVLIAAVALFSVEWIETGRVTARGGLSMAANYLAMAPQMVWFVMYRRLKHQRTRVPLAGAMLATSVLIYWVVPNSPPQSPVFTVVAIGLTPALIRFEAWTRRRAS